MPWLSISESAQALGVSVNTIRWRAKKGAMPARKVAGKRGLEWRVRVEDGAEPLSQWPSAASASPSPSASGEVEALKRTVNILEEQLTSRVREVQELHVLLSRAQLQAPRGDQRAVQTEEAVLEVEESVAEEAEEETAAVRDGETQPTPAEEAPPLEREVPKPKGSREVEALRRTVNIWEELLTARVMDVQEFLQPKRPSRPRRWWLPF